MHKVVSGIVLSLFGFAASAEQVTIAALGDSLTQGYGLYQQEGFVPQLESWLKARGADVIIINAGVSGDTTAGGAARVAWTLTPEVDAMIVALGGNDVLRGVDPAVSRGNIETILQAAKAAGVEVLLIGLKVSGNYGPDYKAEFDAIYPELAAAHGTLYAESFFAGIEGETGDPAEMRAFLQDDGLHPNPEGVKRIVENLGPSVLDLIERAGGSQ
ncbi:arylesterase [Sedimentitalea sp. JM2-8]|uniref:Arylesterase n=2 Tax=Sedimentitalea xiamensis TaxID=3050037 RepID=A0ABT7FAS0_9RHOB|nr:arylesterase [Sedimentitalea xiamensis]